MYFLSKLQALSCLTHVGYYGAVLPVVVPWTDRPTRLAPAYERGAAKKCPACSRRRECESCDRSSDAWDPSSASLHLSIRGTPVRWLAARRSPPPLVLHSSPDGW